MFITAVLWTGFFLINFNIAMMIPLLPFIERDIGLTPAEAGWVLAAFPVTALCSNLALGPLIDRFGRKRFITAGAACCALMLLGTAASHSAGWIVLCRAATGLFMPMVGASVFAAIADYMPAERRGRTAGYVTSAAPVAFLLSVSLGVLLGGLFAWQIPLVLLAIVAAALAAGAATLPPTPPEALSDMPITARTYRRRLLSLSVSGGTGLLMSSYFCWAAALYVFLGLYPTWLVQQSLAAHGAGPIGVMLLVGEVGGLFGAIFSGRLARIARHPFGLCAVAAFVSAGVFLTIPLGAGQLVFQAAAYGVFAFSRDLMLALMLGGAMLLIPAAQRGSLNAMMNATYQTGATLGGLASAWLYAFRPDFLANTVVAAGLLAAAGIMLRTIARRETVPIR